jgi:hypothetical protein
MIKNKNYYHSTTRVMEMGFSDHFAVIMNILVYRPSICSKYLEKRIFSKQNITNFKDQLEIESWDEVYLHSNANSAYCVFLSKFHKYFLDLFPLKKVINKYRKNRAGSLEG